MINRPCVMHFAEYKNDLIFLHVGAVAVVSIDTVYQLQDLELRKFVEKVAVLAAEESEQSFDNLLNKQPSLKNDFENLSNHLNEKVLVEKIVIIDTAT